MHTMTIPLFPLDLVLFPRQHLELRVFEPRYKQLVEDCMLGDKQFGVCLINDNAEYILGWSTPHKVGTLAKITSCNDIGLDGLQLQLDVVGRNPFRIVDIINPSLPHPPEYDPLSVEGHQLVSEMNQKRSPGGKMYIQANVQMLPEIDGDVSLPAWENLVFLWKQNVTSHATSSDVSTHALDDVLNQYYLITDTPTTEYVYSLCALAASGPLDLQVLLESTTTDELLEKAMELMRRSGGDGSGGAHTHDDGSDTVLPD